MIFTLWIFNIVNITDVAQETVRQRLLNGFLTLCVTKEVTGVNVRWAQPDQHIAPGPIDAVVYLVFDPRAGVLRRINADHRAMTDDTTCGITFMFGNAAANISSPAEVYWNRCATIGRTAGAIFHESAHQKSQQDDTMHDFSTPGVGGSGVRVLRRNGGNYDTPSTDDINFYQTCIGRKQRVPVALP